MFDPTAGFCCLADVEVVHELLNLSMGHLNSRDMAGSSPLHDAVWGGHLRVAESGSHSVGELFRAWPMFHVI